MPSRVVYCTIASANYLGRVEVLERSLARHNPGARLEVLLCESPQVCESLSRETGKRFYSPAAIGCAPWLQMAFYYDVTELNTALKPFFVETLLAAGNDAVVYLDPDIEVYASLGELEALLAEHDVVLTPHVCNPVPDDGCAPEMASYIRAGQFNLGFVAVRDGPRTRELLRWWQQVCVERCLFDPTHRYFVDQFWAAAFPSFFERACVLRDPGYNVAYWNVFQRPIELRRDGAQEIWRAGGQPLRFFHFSGLCAEELTRVSVHQNRVRAPVGSDLHRLLRGYLVELEAAAWSRYAKHPYSFARFANGESITPQERRDFLALAPRERAEIEDPFASFAEVRSISRLYVPGGAVRGGGPIRVLLGRARFIYYEELRRRRLVSRYANALRDEGVWTGTQRALRYVLSRLRP